MTLDQLRYLLAVDEQRSFRRAAEAVHVSQPALSMQVRKLEAMLGLRVFDRSKQPVVVTSDGQRVLSQARAIVREADHMVDVLGNTGGELTGRYRLGVIPTLAASLLPRVLPAFIDRHPLVSLVIEELQTEVMLERLAQDQLDGGFAATPLAAHGIHELPVLHEPLYLYAPAGHALLRKKSVRQSELWEARLWIMGEGHCFRSQVLHLCKAHRPMQTDAGAEVVFESGSFETLVHLVDAGLGVTLLPELSTLSLPARARDRQLRPLSPRISREVSLVFARKDLHRGINDALHACAKDSVPAELTRRRGAVLDVEVAGP